MKKEKKGISNGMLIALSIVGVFIFLLLISVSWIWGTYNTLVVATQDIDNQFSNIKTEYQRRADMFYNLVEVTSSYADFEQETLEKVIEARSGAFKGSKESQKTQMNELDSVFSRLMMIMEQYPNLKSIEQYNKLFEEVQRTENRIQIARSDYNALIRSYNILVTKFPNKMLSGGFGYYEQSYFMNDYGTDKAPKINI